MAVGEEPEPITGPRRQTRRRENRPGPVTPVGQQRGIARAAGAGLGHARSRGADPCRDGLGGLAGLPGVLPPAERVRARSAPCRSQLKDVG